MRHFSIKPDSNSGEHYACNTNGYRKVLTQLQDERGEQVRVSLSIEQAEHFVQLIQDKIQKAKQEQSFEDVCKELNLELENKNVN